VDLLDTYVGRHAGERVFQGSILRGEVETISCAILMCDMRGFTAMSNRLERSAMIEILNRSFEAIEAPVEAQGGEILKFIGDGLLAIFRADRDLGDSCRRALEAAIEAQAALSRLGGESADQPPASFAMGLHVGEVAYGNVGGRRRLDFTVLGPAVNYASRLQDLAKRLDAPVLISQAFAGSDPDRFRDIGLHPLRGISAAEQVFAPAG
jgi:adenylate cyclase